MLHRNSSKNKNGGLQTKFELYIKRPEYARYWDMQKVFQSLPDKPMSALTIAHLVRMYYLIETDIIPPPSSFIRMFVGYPFFQLTSKGWIVNHNYSYLKLER